MSGAGGADKDRADKPGAELPELPLEGRSKPVPDLAVPFFAGSGEMADRMRATDWPQTPLGAVATWPQSLKTAVEIILSSRYAMFVWWGRELTNLYNDAYLPFLGKKHPQSLGESARDVWAEIWGLIGPRTEAVLDRGESTFDEALLLIMERFGYPEETYFTFSYSPIRDDRGGIGGLFCAVTDETQRVIGERRLRLLREVAATSSKTHTAEQVCIAVADCVARNLRDLPFAVLYLTERDGRQARLVAQVGMEKGAPGAELVVELGDAQSSVWPLAQAASANEPILIEDLLTRIGRPPMGAWDRPPSRAVLVPLGEHGQTGSSGFLIIGLNPYLPFDEDYRGFVTLLAGQISAGIASARAYQEERRRAEALAEIDRAKTLFFSNVSHEFRTPLTLMLGPLEDTLGSSTLASADRARLDLAYRNSLRLLKLVNSLLDFSRIEAGRAQASYEPTDLSAFTAEIASNFRSACERAGLELSVRCPALPWPVYVDRDMWEKIILNLLSNAFKFTFEGQIAVELRVAGGLVELSVEDTGVGIPDHELPRLFERFHRIEGQKSRTNEGTGIGLALVQELARLHGGSITVESEYGKGSTFRVSVPAGASHLPQQRIGGVRTQASTGLGAHPFIEEALRWLPGEAPIQNAIIDAALPADPSTVPEAHRALILLADDNADMREYLARILSAHYRVEAVADGEAALKAVARRTPSLVLSDVMMPRMDGMELLSRIRADPRTAAVPVILLSARAGEQAKVEALDAGADDYLVKPFSARELLARVDAHLKIASVRGEAMESLRESEERYRAYVTATSDVVYRMSADWSEMRYMQGKDFVPDTENPSRTWLETYIHPDDQPQVLAAINEAIRTGSLFEFEHPVIRVGGTLGWAHSRAVPVFGEDGEILEWFGAARDISERKRHEETQQLLVNELSHRVKNTLAVVQAIAQQTLRQAKDPAEFAASFGGRIQSLSRMHSLLSQSGWQDADLQEIVRDQLAAHEASRVAVSGPPVRLEPQVALHVALMLHELGTNSVKYGALSAAEGAVNVSWAMNDNRLRLEWRERGGPPVKSPLKRGFGTNLIEQTVKGEGGTFHMIVEADGLRWEITLPLNAGKAVGLGKRYDPTKNASLGPRNTPRAGPPEPLRGKRFLIVEDEPLIALDIVAGLESAGVEVAGPVGSVEDALRAIEDASFDGVLLDANLRGEPAGDIAAALTRRNIPFVFVTGYGRQALPESFGQSTMLTKPFTQEQLLETAARLVRPVPPGVRLRKDRERGS